MEKSNEFMYALETKDVLKCVLMIDSLDTFDYVDSSSGHTPLSFASVSEQIVLVEEMLKRGAGPNFKNYYSPIELAISKRNHQITEMLLKFGADPNTLHLNTRNPMIHEATIQDFSSIIPVLIHYGADVNRLNRQGRTALLEAIIYENVDSVKELIKVGANTDAIDSEGNDLKYYAEKSSISTEIMEILSAIM